MLVTDQIELGSAPAAPVASIHGLGDVNVAGVAFDAERPPLQIELVDMIGDKPRPDMGGLVLHLLHEPGALDFTSAKPG